MSTNRQVRPLSFRAGSVVSVPQSNEEARAEVAEAYVGDGMGPMLGYYEEDYEEEQSRMTTEQDDDEGSEMDTDLTRLFLIIDEGVLLLNQHRSTAIRCEDIVANTYDRIRAWLRAHPAGEDRAAACSYRGNNNSTCLHNICKLINPPIDIVQSLMEAGPEMASSLDNHDWLPLHHACVNRASGEVLALLIEAFPEGKTKQDFQGRTPLHFYLAQRSINSTSMAANVGMLTDTGATKLAEARGMLPMHYACAYGVAPSVLAVLKDAYPESVTALESNGRTPMHLALVNAHRDASPKVIEFLLKHGGADSVNMRDHNGYLPLHLLSLGLRGSPPETAEQRNNVAECLKIFLGAEPQPTPDFLTALQDLPEWLQGVAVVSPHVRNILNQKIVQTLPTSIKMLDGYMLILLIIVFEKATSQWIDYRFSGDSLDSSMGTLLAFLYVGGGYFLLRELVQIISMWNLRNTSSWFYDTTNWVDVARIILIFYYSILMSQPADCTNCWGLSDDAFRYGVAITKGVLWLGAIYFLKSTLVDFAVFVGGVLYVLHRLAAFLLAVFVILLLFGQMFYIVYTDTDVCDAEQSGEDCNFPHCTFESSLLKVYTMMMGEIGDETRYETSLLAQILYILYAFVVVILLSNVLIAIVTDSYEVIQNDFAAIVFWSNRLDFVAEMDAVSFGVREKMNLCNRDENTRREARAGKDNNGPFYHGWKNLTQLFDDHLFDGISPRHLEFWCYLIFLFFTAFVVIPLWIIAGLVSAGWLWPPQIREYLFAQRETKISRSDLEKKKLQQLKEIETNVKVLKADIEKEMSTVCKEMTRMRNEVDVVQSEVMCDLQQLRELMTTLLEAGRNRMVLQSDYEA